MSGVPSGDLFQTTTSERASALCRVITASARKAAAVVALMAVALLAACSNPGAGYGGGYQQGYAPGGYLMTPAPGTFNRPSGFYPAGQLYRPTMPAPYQPPYVASQPPPAPPVDDRPSQDSIFGQRFLSGWNSAHAAETSPRHYPDPPVAVDDGEKCGWWRLCNAWSGQ